MDRLRQTQPRLMALLVWIALLAGMPAPASPPPAEPVPYPSLSSQGEPLRTAFNADVGAVRLVLILDPT